MWQVDLKAIYAGETPLHTCSKTPNRGIRIEKLYVLDFGDTMQSKRSMKLNYRKLVNAWLIGAILGAVLGIIGSQDFLSALIGAVIGGIIAALLYGFIAFFKLVRRTERP